MEMDTQAPATDTQAPIGNEFESMAIPETYANTPVGKYKTVGELAKGYENANKLIGAKGVILPGENAQPEEYEKFYNSLGRPEKPEGYKFSPVEGLHPGVKITPEVDKYISGMMHKNGIPQRQADALRKDLLGVLSISQTKQDEKLNASRHEAETKLRNEWGSEYDANLAKAKAVMLKLGGEDMVSYANEGPGNDPRLIKFLGMIGKKMSEDTFIKGNEPGTGNSDVLRQIKNINMDKKHPFWNKDVPGHDEAVAEMRRLNELAFPNERVERQA